MADSDFLIDALCRAAFAPVYVQMWDNGNQVMQQQPSPLLGVLASMLAKAVETDEDLRKRIVDEMCRPDNLKSLVGELDKAVGRMHVVDHYGRWDKDKVPDWVKIALSASLQEWLGTEEANGIVPSMLKNGTIKISVERSEPK